jgi:nitronate monooxygenase
MVGHMLASGDAGKSWRSTRVAQKLGIDYPIIQAPFGGLPSQRLTAAVSNLGGSARWERSHLAVLLSMRSSVRSAT